jgi:hypothetical protein
MSMRILPFAFLYLAVFSVAPVLATQDDGESATVRWHDLRALTSIGFPGAVGVDLRMPLQSSFLDNMEADSGEGPQVPLEESWTLDPDSLIGLLVDVLEAEDVDELIDIEPRAGFLRVRASEAVHQRLAAILAELEAQLLRTVELEVFVMPADLPKDVGPVLDASTTARVLADHPPLDVHGARIPLGRRARLGSQRWQAQMIDYEVEVAEKATVADPQVTRLIEGLEFGAIVHSLPDGRLFLRAWSRNTREASPPRRVCVNTQQDLWIELPHQATSITCGAASLADGGGLLLGHDRHPGGMLLVRARRQPLAQPASGSGTFVPVGALIAPPLIPHRPSVWGPQPSGGMIESDEWHEFEGGLSEGMFEDVWQLEDHLREGADRADLRGLLRVVGPLIYLPGRGADSSATRTLVEGRVAEWTALTTRTVSVDLRFGLLERAAALDLRTGGADIEAQLGLLPWRATGACRPGDGLMIIGGDERFYVQDLDVELANAATNADPVIGNLFTGFTLWCRPSLARGGRIVVYTDLAFHHVSEASRFEPVAWEMFPRQEDRPPLNTSGQVELPVATQTKLRAPVSLADGQWSLVRVNSLQGTDQVLVVAMRAQVLE